MRPVQYGSLLVRDPAAELASTCASFHCLLDEDAEAMLDLRAGQSLA